MQTIDGKKKRFLFAVLLFGFSMFSLSLTLYAEEPVEDSSMYLTYEENEDGTLTITEYNNPGHTQDYHLYIRNTYNGKTVSGIGADVFSGYHFNTVFIDNNIDIGQRAFANSQIEFGLTIGRGSVGSTCIGEYAFANAILSYQPFTIHTNIEIEDYAFYKCSFPYAGILHTGTVSSIGKCAFQKSEYRSGLNLSELTYLGESAFEDSLLRKFTISSTLKTVGINALQARKDIPGLYGIDSYLQIDIERSVSSIESFSLDTLTDTIFIIDSQSPLIDYCINNNMPFYLTNDNPESTSKAHTGQILIDENYIAQVNGDSTVTLLYLTTNEDILYLDETFSVPYHNYNYVINTLPENMSMPGEMCPYIHTLILGNNIKYVDYLFGDTIIETIVLPSKLQSLKNFDISHLTDIIFQVEKDSPILPYLCSYHLIYQFPGEEPMYPNDPDYMVEMDDTNAPENGEDTDDSSGNNIAPDIDSSEESLVEEDSSSANRHPNESVSPTTESNTTQTVQPPAKGSIIVVKKLKYEVTGTNTVTFVGATNKKITTLTIPSNVAYTVPATATTQKKTFSYQVTKVGNKACYAYQKLKKVIVSNKIQYINNQAFANCPRLQEVSLGKGILKLGKKVFYNDKKLTKITLKSTKLKSVGEKTFRGVSKKATIWVPNSKVKAYSKLIKKAK